MDHSILYNWKSPKETQKRDLYKMELAIENGYSIIRIPQETVWNNQEDWEIQLKRAIEEIKEKSVIKNKMIFYFI